MKRSWGNRGCANDAMKMKFEIRNSGLNPPIWRLAGLAAVLLMGLIPAAPAVDWYVATNGPGLGTNGWADATNNFQGAINKSAVNDTIWVSNGVYAAGGVTNYPAGSLLTNRLAIWKSITVRSQNNDPTNTVIRGAWDPAITNGPAAVRCVFMTSNSWLIGFTITNGATFNSSANSRDRVGGGIYCPDITSPAVSNCILTGNSAYGGSGGLVYGGGGIYYGTLYNCLLIGNLTLGDSYYSSGGGANNSILSNCTLTGNSAGRSGGGAYGGTLYNCMVTGNSALNNDGYGLGGGVGGATLYNCTVSGNTANANGGGAYGGTLYNCQVINNRASVAGGGVDSVSVLYNCLLTGNSSVANWGGGANSCSLYNCTVTGNSALNHRGGGVSAYGSPSVLVNCIVYNNYSPYSESNYFVYASTISFTNSCTAPATNGWAVGNITADPMLVNTNSGNCRLAARSPCINTGTNLSWMSDGSVTSKDLDGRQRIRYGTVDMGAYENIRSGSIYGFR